MADKGKDKAAEAGAEDGEGAPKKKKLAGKTLVLFIILPAVLLLGGGGAAAFFLLGGDKDAEVHASEDGEEKHADAGDHGKDDKKDDKAKKDDHGKDAKKDDHGKGGGDHAAAAEGGPIKGVLHAGGDGMPSYYTLPDILVNLTGVDGSSTFLKLKLTLESSDAAAFANIEPVLPRVIDHFQIFLRELRVDDLSGTAGAIRLRRELLRRVNLAIAPKQIDAVLIEEMLVT